MKRLIFLQLNYEIGPVIRGKAFKTFRDNIKKLPSVKIVKELDPKPQVIIEFPDSEYQDVYESLCKLDIVQVIDAVLPKEET